MDFLVVEQFVRRRARAIRHGSCWLWLRCSRDAGLHRAVVECLQRHHYLSDTWHVKHWYYTASVNDALTVRTSLSTLVWANSYWICKSWSTSAAFWASPEETSITTRYACVSRSNHLSSSAYCSWMRQLSINQIWVVVRPRRSLIARSNSSVSVSDYINTLSRLVAFPTS